MYGEEDDLSMDFPVERCSDLPDAAICKNCGKVCSVIVIDFGFGYTEVGSFGMTHHDYQKVSSCCEAEYKELTDADTAHGNDEAGDCGSPPGGARQGASEQGDNRHRGVA